MEVVKFVDETHTYLVNDIPMKRSVTQLVKSFFPEFNSNGIALNMVSRPDFCRNSRYSSYQDMTKDLDLRTTDGKNEAVKRISKSWSDNAKKASELGTEMHQSIEYYYKDQICVSTREFEMFKEFDIHTIEEGYVPFKSEQIVYDTEHSIAGSIDMLYIREEDRNVSPSKVWVVDWKRCKEIKFDSYGGSTGFPPLENKPDCNYQHYSLQLNIYKYLLERNYNVVVEKMSLVILHPDQKKYIEIEVHPMQDLVRRMF